MDGTALDTATDPEAAAVIVADEIGDLGAPVVDGTVTTEDGISTADAAEVIEAAKEPSPLDN